MNGIRIRRAQASEAEAVCAFHVRIWHATYAGYAAPEAVRTLGFDHRLPEWQRRLAAPEQPTWLALQADAIVGMVHFGPASDAVFAGRGQVKYLYVDPSRARSGIGRSLLDLARRQLAAAGHAEMALAVVVQNEVARAFYRAVGGTEGARFRDPGPIWPSENVLVSWPAAGQG